MTNGKRRRVCIDTRLQSGIVGGVEQLVIGLAAGLSSLEDGGEEYLFLADEEAGSWLEPYLGGACRLFAGPQRQNAWQGSALVRWAEKNLSLPLRIWRNTPLLCRLALPRPPSSDGVIESTGAALAHFPTQLAVLTRIPSIYHPHDLQHLHLPRFFSPRERAFRELHYRAFCEEAAAVAVSSSWCKSDLVQNYRLPEEKVVVVPLAPATAAYQEPTASDLKATREKLGVPERFLFYPAQTFPHKNHLAVLEALALIRRSENLAIPFVSSGHPNAFGERIRARARSLGLEKEVQLVGFVTPLELQSLYRLSRAVVIPSLFEAASFPLWEAQLAGVPAACSNVTSLAEQGGDGVLLFDPRRPSEIAQAVLRLWTDEGLRESLIQRGRQSVARFTWERTARIFRAHYRRIARWPMSDEDRALLASRPIL